MKNYLEIPGHFSSELFQTKPLTTFNLKAFSCKNHSINGDAYWSQLMEMHIVKREKLSYICSKTRTLTYGYEKWYAKNKKVKRWLLMSMSLEIMKHYLPTIHEI